MRRLPTADSIVEIRRKSRSWINDNSLYGTVDAQEKLLELERKDRENKQTLDYIEHLCDEQLKGLDRNQQKKRMYREELDKCLADNVRRRGILAEQDKMLNERVVQQRKELDVSL